MTRLKIIILLLQLRLLVKCRLLFGNNEPFTLHFVSQTSFEGFQVPISRQLLNYNPFSLSLSMKIAEFGDQQVLLQLSMNL